MLCIYTEIHVYNLKYIKDKICICALQACAYFKIFVIC